jgi:hypothetical protein
MLIYMMRREGAQESVDRIRLWEAAMPSYLRMWLVESLGKATLLKGD